MSFAESGDRLFAYWDQFTEGQWARVFTAMWDGSGPFGPSAPVPGAKHASGGPRLVGTPDGRLTLAYSCGLRVFTGRDIDSLVPIGSFNTQTCGGHVMSQASDGTIAVAWEADFDDHWLTAVTTADGSFGPVQDLRPDCGPATETQIAAQPNGHAVTTFLGAEAEGWMASTFEPFPGLGRQVCTLPNWYLPPPPPFVPPPPIPRSTYNWATGGAPTEHPSVAAPAHPPSISLASARLRTTQQRPTAILRLRCSAACRLAVTARLSLRSGRAIAVGRITRRARSRQTTLRIRLKPTHGRLRPLPAPGHAPPARARHRCRRTLDASHVHTPRSPRRPPRLDPPPAGCHVLAPASVNGLIQVQTT